MSGLIEFKEPREISLRDPDNRHVPKLTRVLDERNET